jgi:NADPH-dependent ferric siderophore reductase
MAETPAAEKPRARRPRSPDRLVTVEKVERVTPRLTRVTFGGEALAGYGPPRPGAHMKLLFMPEGSDWTPDSEDAPRPPRRTYTPRHFDPATQTLEVEFVHHGHGLAADWVQDVQPGAPLYINGPGGGYDIPADARHVVLAADDTALPAAGTILEALPPGCAVTVLCEVADAAEERALSPNAAAAPFWLHREPAGAIAGVLLEQAMRDADVPDDACWWIACEAAAIEIEHQRDVFKYYFCDATSALEAGNDIRTALLTFGVDASHGYERTHISALTEMARLLTAYAQSPPAVPRDKSDLGSIENFPNQPQA